MVTESTDCLAVGAAMRWELGAVLRTLRRFATVRPLGHGRWGARVGDLSVVVYHTGVGIKSARRKSRELLRDMAPFSLVNTGCAGALERGWAPGDIALAEVIIGPGDREATWRPPASFNDMICDLARAKNRRPPRLARMVTSRNVLPTEADKRREGRRTGAQLVEMEGSGVAQAAAEAGCAFSAVRVVLDPVTSHLPKHAHPPQRRGPGRILRSTLEPTELYRGLLLYRNMRIARRRLEELSEIVFEAVERGTIDPDLVGLR